MAYSKRKKTSKRISNKAHPYRMPSGHIMILMGGQPHGRNMTAHLRKYFKDALEEA